jgi:hypothetical protein
VPGRFINTLLGARLVELLTGHPVVLRKLAYSPKYMILGLEP